MKLARIAAVTALLSLTVGPTAASAPEVAQADQVDGSIYPFNVAKAYPVGHRRWLAILPDAYRSSDWIARLEGVGGAAQQVTVAGRPMVFWTLCKAHSCGFDEVRLLMSADQSRVVGWIMISNAQLQRSFISVGEPSARESACLVAFAQVDNPPSSC